MELPTTRRSSSVPMKQRKASSGVQTIGSLRTLKLVLITTCQPMEAADEVVIDRVGLAMYRLHPRRIVDVGYRRDGGAHNIELVDSEQRLFLRRHVPHVLLGHRSD